MARNVEKMLKEKSFFKDEIEKRFSKEDSEKIWKQAHERLAAIYQAYPDLPKGVAAHTDPMIFPAAAIYLAVKEVSPDTAFDLMELVMKERAQKAGSALAKMAKIPGFKRFFLSMWDPVSHKKFGEAAGFKNVFYPSKKGSFKMDITSCPYNNYLTELGCQELTILFCKNDVYAYGSIPGLTFTRQGTIGGGAAVCDFNMALEK